MSKHKRPSLTFKTLLLQNPAGLMVATLIGAVASVAGVALLGISGWFLSAAGLASATGTALAFNYFTPGALVRLMAILRTAGRYGEQVFAHDYLLGLLRSLRLWVWDQRVATPTKDVHRQTRGDLLQRVVSDLDQIIKWPLAVIMPWVYAVLACAALAGLASWVAPQLLWPVLVYSALQLIVLPWLAQRFAMRTVYTMQALASIRRGRFIALFQALITLTIRGHWHGLSQRLEQLDQRQKAAQYRLQRVSSLCKLVSQGFTLVLVVTLVSLTLDVNADAIVLREDISAPFLVALILASLAVNEVVQPLTQAVVAQGESRVGLKRLNQLDQGASIRSNVIDLPSISSFSVTGFAGVYSATQRPPQQRANFSINKGEKVRLVGSSGAGKSACLAALAGDIGYLGTAFVNDQGLDLQDHSVWRQHVAYLPQQAVIFQQSLAANLRLGYPQASDTDLTDVLNILGLGEWVEALPQGLNTLLGTQGRDVSGGQARRIALARVLLRKSNVLLLDEPFDGLDSSSIARVCEAIERSEYRPQFLIYVSHINTELDKSALDVAVS